MINIYRVRRLTALILILLLGYVVGVGGFNAFSTTTLVGLLVFYIMSEDLKDCK